jgi:hypothetical protein
VGFVDRGLQTVHAGHDKHIQMPYTRPLNKNSIACILADAIATIPEING